MEITKRFRFTTWMKKYNQLSHSHCKSTLRRPRFVMGRLFGARYSNSEDCSGASIGSADLWFDAKAALVHATNASGAFGISIDTLHGVLQNLCVFLTEFLFCIKSS